MGRAKFRNRIVLWAFVGAAALLTSSCSAVEKTSHAKAGTSDAIVTVRVVAPTVTFEAGQDFRFVILSMPPQFLSEETRREVADSVAIAHGLQVDQFMENLRISMNNSSSGQELQVSVSNDNVKNADKYVIYAAEELATIVRRDPALLSQVPDDQRLDVQVVPKP